MSAGAGRRAHTARDLLRAAEARRQPVPVLLAVTILVETLNALAAGRRRGGRDDRGDRDALNLDLILLNGAPTETLLDDPTRDPKVELADSALRGDVPGTAGAGAVFFELLTGSPPPPERPFSAFARNDLPAAVEPLLRRLLAPRATERLDIADALSAARAIGIELLEAWDRKRRQSRLEDDLRQALDQRREPRVRELADALAELAPRSEWVRRARTWLDVRSRNARALAVAREQHERQARRREETKRVSLKLLLTGAPLIFATFLTGLLAVVMFFTGSG